MCLYGHLEEKGEWISYKHIGMPGKEFDSALSDFFVCFFKVVYIF